MTATLCRMFLQKHIVANEVDPCCIIMIASVWHVQKGSHPTLDRESKIGHVSQAFATGAVSVVYILFLCAKA